MKATIPDEPMTQQTHTYSQYQACPELDLPALPSHWDIRRASFSTANPTKGRNLVLRN